MISIIVPVYNVRLYLERCVFSLINQTYKDLEIILVDDGSTDGSKELADQLESKYPVIKVIHKANGGLSSARNAGLDVFQGDYVMFVDSDDYLAENTCEVLYKYAQERDSQLVEYGMIKIFDDGSTIVEPRKFKEFTGSEAVRCLLRRDHVIKAVAWDSLYHRSIFDTIRFDIGRLHEDTWFKYKALYNSNRVTIIPESMYYYVQGRPDSIMTTPIREKNVRDLLDAYEYRWQYFIEKNEIELADMAKAAYMSELLSFYYIVNGRLVNNDSIKKISREIIFKLKQYKSYILTTDKLLDRRLKFMVFYHFRFLSTLLSNLRYKLSNE